MSQNADERIGVIEIDTGKYKWSQSIEEVCVVVTLPAGIRAKDIVCQIQPSKIIVQIKGQDAIINGELFGRIKSEDSCWTVDGRELTITLLKQKRHEVWLSVVKGIDELNPSDKDKIERKMMLQKYQEETPGFDFSGAEFTGAVPKDPANFNRFN